MRISDWSSDVCSSDLEAEGWTPERDDQYSSGEMAEAAAAYASESAQTHAGLPNGWPWSVHWWKPGTPRENLVKAGALILAEIEIGRASCRERVCQYV